MFLIDRLTSKMKMPTSQTALPGRPDALPTSRDHFVNGHPIGGEVPEGMEEVYLGMGCFWGVERLLWEKQGIWVTAVGYQGGVTLNPTYNEVCTGLTGHNETVRVVFDPSEISFEEILQLFWESHDPTQGMRQGNDTGTQYRSGIYTTSAAQKSAAEASKAMYGEALTAAGKGAITTEIMEAPTFYYAEEYHQQYLAKNPEGYCNLSGAGVSCPVPASASMTLEEFDRFCGALPSTEMVIQWGGAHVWKVGGKVFAIASIWGEDTGEHKIGFKATDMSFQMLTEEPDILPSPYLGRYKWVQLQTQTALNMKDLKAYLKMAHELIVAKLTKTKRKELGL